MHPHTLFSADRTLTTLSHSCVTARVQPLARWHRCCETSQGEHLPHQTQSLRQPCGRRRRRCSCGRPAGNGFDVQELCVQGVCLLSQQMSLHKIVSRVGVVNLFCSVRCGFFDFSCGLKENVYSCLCRGNCARVVFKLIWHGDRTE